MTRKLFYDMASELMDRFTAALWHMSAWAGRSQHATIMQPLSFDLRECPDAYNNNIDEICVVQTGWGWKFINQDGQFLDLNTIDLMTLGSIIDWIERTYSPNHKCGDPRI